MKLPWTDLAGFRRRPAPGARLVPLEGAETGIVQLGSGALSIGRSQESGLHCADPALSRTHARLTPSGSTWRLEDLSSANGTTVDGQPITSADLTSGCTITFGDKVSYRFETVANSGRRTPLMSGVFCPQLVPERGGRPFVLKRRLTVVGRNETSDLRLNETQVSAVHARLVRRQGLVTLRDTGSSNGTAVNGVVVRQQQLEFGDRVVFGDVPFTYQRSWVPTGMGLTGLGVAGLVIALVVLLWSVFFPGREQLVPLWTRDMYLAQVETSLEAVVKAYDRAPRETKVALAQFDIARRSMIAAELLRPDRQTEAEVAEAVREAAMAPHLQKALRGRDLVEMLANLERAPAASGARPPKNHAFDLTRELSLLVAEFGIDTRDTPIPAGLVAEVDRFTKHWSVRYKKSTEAAFKRGQPYLDMMRRELRRQRLPEVFCYLPFIESSYKPAIKSPAGARGFWQFMPGTARDYGLRVDDNVDQRTDPELSTRAACQYLEYLLRIFGPNSFMCAVAAYNKGHNGMRRCLNKSGDLQSTWKFWKLSEVHDGCLPRETMEYVPRFLAAVVIFRNPEEFGLGKLE